MSNYFFLTLPDKACSCTEIPIFKVVDMTVRILADNLHVSVSVAAPQICYLIVCIRHHHIVQSLKVPRSWEKKKLMIQTS